MSILVKKNMGRYRLRNTKYEELERLLKNSRGKKDITIPSPDSRTLTRMYEGKSINEPVLERVFNLISLEWGDDFYGFLKEFYKSESTTQDHFITAPINTRLKDHNRSSLGRRVDETFLAIQKNFANFPALENDVFSQAILEVSRHYLEQLKEWSRGELFSHSSEAFYHNVAVALYEHAEDTVFSTCIPRYLHTWETELGQELLRAHKAANVDVTRVFLFEKRVDVNDDAIHIMRKQAKEYGINVRVLIEEYNLPYRARPGVSKDFTIVDNGTMIGVTEWKDGKIGARWYFADNNIKGMYTEFKENIMNTSQSLEEFLESRSRA